MKPPWKSEVFPHLIINQLERGEFFKKKCFTLFFFSNEMKMLPISATGSPDKKKQFIQPEKNNWNFLQFGRNVLISL